MSFDFLPSHPHRSYIYIINVFSFDFCVFTHTSFTHLYHQRLCPSSTSATSHTHIIHTSISRVPDQNGVSQAMIYSRDAPFWSGTLDIIIIIVPSFTSAPSHTHRSHIYIIIIIVLFPLLRLHTHIVHTSISSTSMSFFDFCAFTHTSFTHLYHHRLCPSPSAPSHTYHSSLVYNRSRNYIIIHIVYDQSQTFIIDHQHLSPPIVKNLFHDQ